jgi:hypothetical protein
MGKLSQGQVPPGFEFQSYSKDVKVDVLGKTEKTVLSPTEADLQVTFKFYIVPVIDKQKTFDRIKGMNSQAAFDELNKIADVDGVEISILPNIPFFNKIPANISNVDIKVKIGE